MPADEITSTTESSKSTEQTSRRPWREPRPERRLPEDEGITPELAAARRSARRAGHRAAQAAYREAYRHDLRLTQARTPERGLPGGTLPGALGALIEAYHRWYDRAYPGKCVATCHIDALRLLAFLPEPWRLTDDPSVRDRHTWTVHGLSPDLLALLPTPWRLVANASIARPQALDEKGVHRLLWAESRSAFVDFDALGAPGEPADWQEGQARATAALLTAAAAGREPDLTTEGPTMSVRRFVLRLWAQARREHWGNAEGDAFLVELRRQLVELREHPHGGRRR